MNQNEMIAYLIIGVVVIGIIIFVVMKMSSGSGSGDGSGSGSSATPPPGFFDTTTTTTPPANPTAAARASGPFIPPGTGPAPLGGTNPVNYTNSYFSLGQYIGGPESSYVTASGVTLGLFNGQLALNYNGKITPVFDYPNVNTGYVATLVAQPGGYALVVYDYVGNIVYQTITAAFQAPIVAVTPLDGTIQAVITAGGSSTITVGVPIGNM